jgi:hypothetical protein
MVVTADQISAALLVTGDTPVERRIQDILDALPYATEFTTQCLYRRELQKALKVIFPELVVGEERQFNHVDVEQDPSTLSRTLYRGELKTREIG